MIRLLKTMVHVESRRRLVRARNISATPASPACVATKICSTYLDFGAASYTCVSVGLSWTLGRVHCVALRRELERTAHAYLDLGAAFDALFKGARHVSLTLFFGQCAAEGPCGWVSMSMSGGGCCWVAVAGASRLLSRHGGG